MISRTVDEAAEALKADLNLIELNVMTEGYTIAKALRDAANVGVPQEHGGWGNGVQMCAWSAIGAVARARGLA